MKVTLCILAVLVVCALAQDTCMMDSDCHDGCCMQGACTTMAKLNQPCDLDGHSNDACPCEKGLDCQALDGHNHHLGTCVSHV